VSLIIRWDSAAIVSKTSELLPEPETPVNTVRRRFGMSTLMSLRLLTRAPCTLISSWLSAAGLKSSTSESCHVAPAVTSRDRLGQAQCPCVEFVRQHEDVGARETRVAPGDGARDELAGEGLDAELRSGRRTRPPDGRAVRVERV